MRGGRGEGNRPKLSFLCRRLLDLPSADLVIFVAQHERAGASLYPYPTIAISTSSASCASRIRAAVISSPRGQVVA